MNKIKLYACGGAGLNVAAHFTTKNPKRDIEPVFIDTSRSNITKGIPEDNLYLIEGLDGSGKVRAENHVQIGECILDILKNHSAGDLNVVLSSGSGGSGSVIAPSLVSELLSRDVPTVVIIIGGTDSRIELENTIRTLKSYESIAQMRKTPVVALYFENTETKSRKAVDADVHRAIDVLATLFSGNISELDSSDLRNWLRYTKVTSYDAHLTNLEFFIDKVNLTKPHSVITVATLTDGETSSSTGCAVEYQCVGMVDPKSVDFKLPMHSVIMTGVFDEIHKALDQKLKALDESRNARIVRSNILSDKDRPTSSGLVL
jgi:hypothetical protein